VAENSKRNPSVTEKSRPVGGDYTEKPTSQYQAQQEPEQDLKQLSAQALNKSYQGLQQQIKRATDPQQKSELKNQLNAVHQEISSRTQKQLKTFTEENPGIKQPDPESDQSRKC
jgi:uncharacterized membrane protein YccC